jgi:hypothetical protein
MVALLFVKLYYSIAIRVAMILPERAGKVKEPEKRADKPLYIETPPEKQARGTARPTYARLISAFLSIAFVFTFLPAISVTVEAADMPVNFARTEDPVLNTSNSDYPDYYDSIYYVDADADVPTDAISFNNTNTGYGNGSVVLSLNRKTTPVGEDEIVDDGYDGIDVFITRANGDSINGSDAPYTSFNADDTELIIAGLPNNEPLNFRLVPYYSLQEYIRILEKPGVTDDPSTDANEYKPAVTPDYQLVAGRFYKISQGSRQITRLFTALDNAQGLVNGVEASYNNGTATIKWLESAGASGYLLYRESVDSETDELELIKRITGGNTLETTDTTADTTTVYSYRVRAYRGITPKYAGPNTVPGFVEYDTSGASDRYYVFSNNYSTSSSRDIIITEIDKPSNGEYAPVSTGNQITWQLVPKITNAPGTAGYDIYRLTDSIIESYFTTLGTPVPDIDELTAAQVIAMTPRLRTITKDVNTFIDTTADRSATYYYAVMAYRIQDVNYITGNSRHVSEPLIIETDPGDIIDAPANVEALPDDNELAFWVNGDAVTDAKSYIAEYRTVAADNTLGTARTVESPTLPISISGLTKGQKYQVKLQAIDENGNPGRQSEPATVVVGYYTVGQSEKPVIRDDATTVAMGEITIEWNPASTPDIADYYNVHRQSYDETAGSWSAETIVGRNIIGYSFTDDTVVDGVTYRYRTEAVKENTNGSVPDGNLTQITVPIQSNRSASIKAGSDRASLGTLTAQTPTTNEAEGTMSLSWQLTRGANTTAPADIVYTVYAYENGSTAAHRVIEPAKVSASPHIFSLPTDGKLWRFYVIAEDENDNYVSAKSNEIVFRAPAPPDPVTPPGGGDNTNPDGTVSLLKPRDFYVTAGENQADLEWGAVNGAEGYIVYATGPTGTFQFDITQPGFTHTSLRGGDAWTYRVVAYTIRSGDLYNYSPSTDPRTVTIGGEDLSGGGGSTLPAPLDFRVVTTDGQAELSWTEVADAYSYTVTATGAKTTHHFDVSEGEFLHDRLLNGEEWTYSVTANRLASGGRTTAGRATEAISVIIGQTLYQPQDLLATNGNRQVDLTWTEVDGAEGYIVYLYNNALLQFEPLTVTSESLFSHTGLINGTRYSYMVAAYKYINNKQILSPYSLTVFGVPTTGSPTDLDRLITVKGALPYGMDHSELVEAYANHGAFDEDVDVYVSSDDEARKAVRNELSGYGKGLESFIIYPFDVTVYYSGTRIEATPNSGFGVTFTMPLPDELVRYRDYINVVHINDMGQMEILKSTLNEINGNWCISYVATGFSPYAFVIYKDQIIDASSETFAEMAANGTNSFNLGSMLTVTAMFTSATPTIKRSTRRKVYRIKKIR